MFQCGIRKNILGNSQVVPSDLEIEVLNSGVGRMAQVGDLVSINESISYRGGTLLFSTDQIGHPVTFMIGANQVIEGVDWGVRGNKVGEKRKLIVPTSLSKRTSYSANLSPESILVYLIEMITINE